MSEPASQPGAPADGAVHQPSTQEKSVAAEVKQRVPNRLLSIASTPDRLILRLNKLLASPGGLSAFLSTFNYTLYLLAYLEAKTAPLQARLYAILTKVSGLPVASYLSPALVPEQSKFAALGALFSQTRTVLRLFGLPPMYAWMRQLLQGPKPGQDQVLYMTSLTQCSLYMTFQFLENVALLTDHAILPARYTQKYLVKNPAAGTKPTQKIYLWAYRAWFGGILCDFVRLAREAQLERNRRAARTESSVSTREEDEKADAKWWSSAVVPISWTPMAAQVSSETGFSWFNLGIMGASGMFAGLGRTAELWAATADVK